MTMCGVGKFFNIQHRQRGVSDNLAKHSLRVLLKGSVQLRLRRIRRNEGRRHAHLRQRHSNQIIGAAIDRGGRNNVAACLTDVEEREEVGRLAGGCQHSRNATLQLCKLRCHIIAGRVLQTRVKITGRLQVEQPAHLLARIVLKGSGLDNRNLTRLAAARFITAY